MNFRALPTLGVTVNHMLLLALMAHMQLASPDTAYWERIAGVMAHKNYRLAEMLIRHAPLRDDEDKLRQQTMLARVLLLEKRYDEAEPLLVKLLDKDPALSDRHLLSSRKCVSAAAILPAP